MIEGRRGPYQADGAAHGLKPTDPLAEDPGDQVRDTASALAVQDQTGIPFLHEGSDRVLDRLDDRQVDLARRLKDGNANPFISPDVYHVAVPPSTYTRIPR